MEKRKIIMIVGFIVSIIVIGLVILLINISKEEDNDSVNQIGVIDFNNLENVKLKDNEKYNVSKKIKKVHDYDTFKFDNMKIYSENGTSTLEFKITNISFNREIINYSVFITFYDKNKNDIYSLIYSIPSIRVNESKNEIIKDVPFDIVNAYDYEVQGL